MIIDRSHQDWIARSAAIGVGSALLYLLYFLFGSPNGPRGGSAPGLAFGFAGTGLIAFECLLSLRKKYPASPLARVESWLRAHIWLGLLSFLLILFHAGFHWGRGLSSLLMWLFVIILASGVYGLVLQHTIPRRMTELVIRETTFEQIPEVIGELRREADERVEFITADLGIEEEEEEEAVRAGGKKFYFDEAQRKSAREKVDAERRKRKSSPQIVIDDQARLALRANYLQEIRPFLERKPPVSARRLFQKPASLAAYFKHLRIIMPVAAHHLLEDLEQICEERRQLAVQERLHVLLHGWLFVHVPVSMVFLVLILVHAVMSLRY